MKTLGQLDFLTNLLWEKKRDYKIQNDLVKKELDEMKLPYWNRQNNDDDAKAFKETRKKELEKQKNKYTERFDMVEAIIVWLDKDKTKLKKDENSSK